MAQFDSMADKLSPLGVYDISEGTNIYNELKAYGEALDVHREHIDEVLRECFISSAQTYGIELREKVIGDAKSLYPLSKRREMLTLRKGFNENDFTRAGLYKFLDSFGITDYRVIEMPSQRIVSVFVGGSYPDSEVKWIENQIRLILPAHLNAVINFGGRSWHSFQLMNKTFAQLDEDNLSWAQIHLQ